MLVEFASVVDAVRCAVEIQRGMAERNANVPADQRIDFRIGINVGDIIVEDDDIFGDGVNVAARLEALAEPGGICVSASVRDQVRRQARRSPSTICGEQQVKNIARPVRVYRVDRTDAARRDGAPVDCGDRLPALPDRPSIAVLPFQNMSGDPEQEYFADGIVEDIITGLSRIKWLFVIARNSSFVYKGRAVDVKQVGRELGVRYVLEGSLRKAGNRVRVTAQLIEAESGAHVWAERYDRALDDIFELQDEMTLSVVGAIEPSLRQAEIERAKRKRPENLDAYDLYLRALPHAQVSDAGRGRQGACATRSGARARAGLPGRARLRRLVLRNALSCVAACRRRTKIAALAHAQAAIEAGRTTRAPLPPPDL